MLAVEIIWSICQHQYHGPIVPIFQSVSFPFLPNVSLLEEAYDSPVPKSSPEVEILHWGMGNQMEHASAVTFEKNGICTCKETRIESRPISHLDLLCIWIIT